MNLIKNILILVLTVLLISCTAIPNYTPPLSAVKYPVSVTINKSKNELWPILMKELSNEFFVINNIDKSSGLINLSYDVDPTNYIDCGFISFNSESNIDKQKASSKMIKFPFNGPFENSAIRTYRYMSLSGRINVFVNQVKKYKTVVKVNIRYKISKRVERKGAYPYVSNAVSNSNDRAVFREGTICYPTGKLERKVLDAIEM